MIKEVIPDEEILSEVAFAKQLLMQSNFNSLFSTDIPEKIQPHLEASQNILNQIEQLVSNQGHGDYFKASVPRYLNYLAAAMTILRGCFKSP
ncbi:hypothetical protein [Nostoc sp. TCL26-01]|uniref:hypothetical protein n=1 Tax=Nostoc sp. TCL26-01 TaxID=2576904 RepID=UPI0015BA5A66|nr:hypothetical protein [Nostoc sp. TCL26-01]QLE57815.1 hypothetical protein FD725_21240 [Nostoc sp. TCL26-01]